MAQGVENQHQTEESRKNVKPASVKEQRKVVADALDETPKKGQTWYLVEAKWFKAFQTYVNYERYGKSNEEAPAEENFGGDHPGPIDNTPLIVAEDSQSNSKIVRIHEHVQDKKDFELLPESAWTQISSWYGGGPAIARQVIEQGEVNKRTLIELHPYVIFAAVYTSDQATSDAEAIQFEEMAFSKTTTLQEVTDAIASKHRVDDKEKFELRLWAGYKGSPYKMYKTTELPKELEYTITRTHGQQVILEVKDRSSLQEDAWPISYKHSASMGAGVASQKTGIGGLSSGFLRGNDTEIVSRHSTKSTNSWIGGASGNFQGGEPGVCGLQNLGNTCFMNSALQCLTKTPFFVDYFNAGKYVKEINTTNPLGMGGKIAEAFGNLMQEVWSGKHSYTAPREFKWIIGKFKPEFSGYNQQDSHELITFLLDGLHEDLNRIVDKPQTNSVEANGRADEEVSKEAWEVHKKRNDSIIVDRFQGQLKSTIVCPEPECVQENFVSITFDPFMYLGLSLPTEKNRIVDVTVYRFGNDLAPVKYGVKVSKNGPSSELRQALAKMINDANAEQPGFVPVKAEEFVLADIFNNKIYRFIPDTSPITSISESDTIHAYEVPGLTKECHSEYDNYSSKQPPFFGVRLCTVERHEQYYGVSLRTVSVGIPFVLPYDKSKTTKKDVYNQALKFVSRYIKKEALPEFKIDWEDPASFLPTPKKKLEAKEGEEQIVKAPAEAEQKNILFEMKFDSGYLEESNDPAILYSDDLVSKQEDNEDEELGRYNYRRSYVSEKKNLMLLIHPAVLSKLVEKERLNQITVHSTGKGVVEKKEKGVSLEDCLTLYTTKETLSQENTYYCPKCKKHVQATQKFDIWKAPEILVIHLKRFQNNRYTRDKIETYVDYPYTLDISSHLPEAVKQQEHTVYDLYAVSNHFGGLGGGHYTAYAKVHTNNKWYKFDDSSTMEVDAANVKTSAGYVLFYRSRKSSNSVELPTK